MDNSNGKRKPTDDHFDRDSKRPKYDDQSESDYAEDPVEEAYDDFFDQFEEGGDEPIRSPTKKTSASDSSDSSEDEDSSDDDDSSEQESDSSSDDGDEPFDHRRDALGLSGSELDDCSDADDDMYKWSNRD